MRLRKYNEIFLRKSILESFSLRETLKKLGVSTAGGNYQSLKKAIIFFKINIDHFSGRGHLKGKKHNFKKRPIESILVYGKLENTYRLKHRLINEGLKKKVCENCLLDCWLNGVIPLELHHIDGDRKNNQMSNLKLLCCNCHALTSNYRGKNRKV